MVLQTKFNRASSGDVFEGCRSEEKVDVCNGARTTSASVREAQSRQLQVLKVEIKVKVIKTIGVKVSVSQRQTDKFLVIRKRRFVSCHYCDAAQLVLGINVQLHPWSLWFFCCLKFMTH